MADKITPTTLTSMANEAAFIAAINANFTSIAEKIDTLVSRDGDTPNHMTANLDMNSKRVINLPAPLTDNEPLRRGDVVEGSVIAYLADAEQAAIDAEAAKVAAQAAQAAAEAAVTVPASTTVSGIVELATNAETVTGIDATRATTPAGIAAALAGYVPSIPDASTTVKGIVELATDAEAQAMTDPLKAITADNLDALFNTGKDMTYGNSSFTLPGGLIIKTIHGVLQTGDGSTQTLTFTTPFPNQCLIAIPADKIASASAVINGWWQVISASTTNVVLNLQGVSSMGSSAPWVIVIGH